MSKFGELIDVEIPVLLDFYAEWNDASMAMHPILKEVATAVGEQSKIIKIDVDKNKELSQALRIKGLPTLMIYKRGEMVWRQSGEQDADTLISILQEYH